MLPGFYDVIHSRRDVRAEFSGEPVDEEVLARVLGAAHSAPSVGLSQPWDFILVRSVEQRRRVKEVFEAERQKNAAEFSGERSIIHALPSGVPGSAMRAYMILRPASQ